MKVSATDADENENSQLTYFIPEERMTSLFEVDRRTGIVKTKSSLNREQTASYRFYVCARDHGTPSQTGTTVMHVNVGDVNDELPVMTTNPSLTNI